MSPAKIKKKTDYDHLVAGISSLFELARKGAARAVNAVMTAAYWEIGRRIIEFEQKGSKRADYGEELLKRLSKDLTSRYGRGFAKSNLYQMRSFYLDYQDIFQTLSGKSKKRALFLGPEKFQTPSGKLQTASAESVLHAVATAFPLPWSAYVRLLSVKNREARRFYETETLRGGWSVKCRNIWN